MIEVFESSALQVHQHRRHPSLRYLSNVFSLGWAITCL